MDLPHKSHKLIFPLHFELVMLLFPEIGNNLASLEMFAYFPLYKLTLLRNAEEAGVSGGLKAKLKV